MADTSAWTVTEGEAVAPSRGHAELAGALVAPAFAPDLS